MDKEDMNKADLIKKYEQMRYMNNRIYFDADEFSEIANHYIQEKNISEAENVVRIGLSMHPYSTELMIAKVKVLVASEKYEEGNKYLNVIVGDGTDEDLLLLKIECLLKLDREEEAHSFIKYVLGEKLNQKERHNFLFDIGNLFNRLEVFDKAVKYLEWALNLDLNIKVLKELAYAYEMNDNMSDAIEMTNLIIDLDPYSFSEWVHLGRLHMYNYEYELSIEAYDFALAIKEADVDVLKLKAITYSENYDFENELKVLNECIDAAPHDESLYDEVLQKYKEFEDYWGIEQDEGILKVLEKKEAQFGTKGLLLKMAHLNLRLNEVEKALEIYNRIPEEEKHTVEYYKLQGNLAIHTEDYVAAEVAYKKALEKSPNDVEALDYLAEIYSDFDRHEEAAACLDKLIALDPERGIAKFRLAIVRFEIGEKEPFKEIINKISDNEQLGMLLGMFTFVSREKREKIDHTQLTREELLIGLDEAREYYVQLRKEREEEKLKNKN